MTRQTRNEVSHHRDRTRTETTSAFRHDVNRCLKRPDANRDDLKQVMQEIQRCERVPDHRRPHTLRGEYEDCWECHIDDDWLIIWRFVDENTVHYIRTGTHGEIFG